MQRLLSFFVLFTVLPISSFATDKGTCPPPPPAVAYSQAKKDAQKPKKGQDSVGTIAVLTLVSDTGYVCSAEVVQGLDKKTDSETVKAVRQWHFDPAKKDGRPVPVVIVVQVDYRLDEDGHVLIVKAPQGNEPDNE